MAFDEKKFVGTDALSELSTKVKTELDKKTDKAGALTNVSYDTTNKKFTKTTQGAHDPVTTDIVSTSTLKTDMGIADFDGTFSSLKSKPTTISGYGITDAKVQNSTVTIGSNSVTALTQEDVSSTYDSSGTSPVDGKAVAAALGTLDVESVGGAGKYISAISETDGKISATAETMDSTPTSNSTKAVTSDGIYEYVNSSVATNTAYFIGTFDSVEELEAYSGIITNNDYAFVTSTDSSGNTLYNRYKYNDSTHTWSFEYALNNSSFTSAQWATIQSGLTSSDKTKLDGIQSGANKTIVDAAMSSSSTNPVQNKVVYTALAGKQDTLTFDSTPTQSSTNPVTSAGIYTDQARQDTLEAQDRAALIEVENKGAKNLLKLGFTHKSAGTQTADMTADGNGIIVNGDRNTTTDVILVYDLVTNQSNMLDTRYTLPAGKYVIPSTGTSNLRYQVYCHDGTNYQSLGYTMSNPLEFEYTSALKAQYPYIAYRLWASRVSSFSNLTVYPMVCSKAEWDISQAYEPYALPNPPITAKMIEDVDGRAKNVLYYTKVGTSVESGSQYLSNGVRFTLQSDSSILVNRESSNANEAFCNLRLNSSSQFVDDFCNGQYVLSGSYGDCILRATNNTYNAIDTGNGVVLQDRGAQTSIWVQIRVAASASPNNVTVKPMICTLTDWNISHKYVPYKQDITWGFGDKIPQNSDFNSYIIPGVYRVENSTDAATMLHIPVTNGGGRLEVKGANASNRIIQTYYISTSTFTRYYNGTAWSDWVQILSTATLDEIPTANSTNAVMSGGVWADQQRQETEIGVVANAGAKNFLDVQHPTITTRTSYTPLANGGVELSCSNAVWTSYAIANIPVEVGKEYAITFLLDESSGTSNFYFFLRNGDSSGTNLATKNYGSTTGNYEASFTPSNSVIWLGIYLNNSATAATATAKLRCMIRPAAITDTSYQPYARTNPELTVLTDEDRAALVEIVDGGAKNLSQFNSGTAAYDNVTLATGIPLLGHAGEVLVISYETALSSGISTIGFKDANGTSTGSVEIGNVTKQKIVTIPEGTAKFNVFVSKAGTYTNFMICTKAAWQISKTYQPYRPSWQEMYDRVSTLDGITAKIVYTNALLVSTGTSIGSTGLEYTIKGTSTDTYRLTAVGSYNASQPDELRLVNKVTGSLYGIATRSDVGTNASIIVSGCVATGSNITVEVQAKYVSAGDNYIRLIVEKIPMN